MYLNNKKWHLSHVTLLLVRRRARKRHSGVAEHNDVKKQLAWKVHICSENNFPTAAGLASSAAGLACLGLCSCCCILLLILSLMYLVLHHVREYLSDLEQVPTLSLFLS